MIKINAHWITLILFILTILATFTINFMFSAWWERSATMQLISIVITALTYMILFIGFIGVIEEIDK